VDSVEGVGKINLEYSIIIRLLGRGDQWRVEVASMSQRFHSTTDPHTPL
jgi:hypothetical protein